MAGGTQLRLSVGAASNIGLVRERNEDSAMSTAGLYAVADGMGGHAAGDVASRLAVAALMRLAGRDDLEPADLKAAIAAANADLLAATEVDGRHTGMGTTLTGVALVHRRLHPQWAVFNVGDSRVYRFADDTLTQLTVDHSEVQELLDSKLITAEDAKLYHRRNVVTRSLGTIPGPRPDVRLVDPVPGERFLICSDGLTIEVDHETIAAVLAAETDPQRAADRLVATALDAGGRDNVTVLVIDHLVPAGEDAAGEDASNEDASNEAASNEAANSAPS
jgi:PPM family protein phosphatase